MYLTKVAQDAMSREELYLLTQTMRIFNSIRLFVLIADDIRRLGPNDTVNQRKFIELLLYQAGNLNEVLVALKEDLFSRYKNSLKNVDSLAGLSVWEERIRTKDETVRVLEAIRNKHTFHVPYDKFYVWNYLTDDPATADKLLGVGETIQGGGWFFTWDFDIILAYLKDHILDKAKGAGDAYIRVKHIIDQASNDLYVLFNGIVQEMMKGKIYGKGEKKVGPIPANPKNEEGT